MVDKGLKGVVAAETELSFIDGNAGILLYRGYDAKELAIRYSFEEVAYLLWYGSLPNSAELQFFKAAWVRCRQLPEPVIQCLNQLPSDMNLMSQLRTAVSVLGTTVYEGAPHVEQAMSLTAVMPAIIANLYRKKNGLPVWESIPSNDSLSHAAHYLYLLTGEVPTDIHASALETYMILTMEHGLNASTFTARVITSTESDMVSALTGALGAMKGPLHGGAPSGVTEMLEQIGTADRAEDWLRGQLEQRRLLMGFGHRIYRTRDPRAEALKMRIVQMEESDHWLDLAQSVEDTAVRLLNEYKPGRKLYANVEFYAAAIMRAIGLPSELFTPTFSASRTVGWTAHMIEQAKDNVIYRPDARYIGSFPATEHVS